MKTLLKIFTAAISIVLLTIVPERTHSCGPDLATDEVRFALFRTEVAGDDVLENFQYTHAYLNGGGVSGQ